MTCIRRNLNNQNCCNAWQKGIRTINSTYPDDNREFEISGGAGILITPITAGILITNTTDPAALEAGSNIELTPNGGNLQIRVVDGPTFEDDTTINGDLNVNGNIYNQGASYESHMEQVYTTNDYIIMRENAVTGLAAGSYAGFQVKLYDGVNDGRLVMDNSGTARVGDVGDEQPLLTREESGNLTDGALLKWDAINQKAVDEGTIGDDTHPVKIVNGVATAVTTELMQHATPTLLKNSVGVKVYRWYKIVLVSFEGYNHESTEAHTVFSDVPTCMCYALGVLSNQYSQADGMIWIQPNAPNSLRAQQLTSGNHWGSFIYFTNDP